MSVLPPVQYGKSRQYQEWARDVGQNLMPIRDVESRVILAKSTAKVGDTTGRIRVLLNPTSLRIRQDAEWTQHGVVGLSYEPTQYNRTRNAEVSAQFYFSAMEAARQGMDLDGFERLRYFFDSLLYPQAPGLAPPLVVFIWPHVLTFIGVCDAQSTEIRQFGLMGAENFTITTEFFEVRGLRYAPQVARQGRYITDAQRAQFDTNPTEDYGPWGTTLLPVGNITYTGE